MPELPEVETTVNGLKPHVEHATIQKVIFHRANIRYPLDPSWIDTLADQDIHRVHRRAKLIIMDLETGHLLWHLGMTGSMRISDPNEEKRKHDHVEINLSNQRVLRFHDPRRFGYLQYYSNLALLTAKLAPYGPEPLSDDFTCDYLWRLSHDSKRPKKQPIKNFIMNQATVVGVGNIYACEALFMAGISPKTPCGSVSLKRYQLLVSTIKKVLTMAIEKGGTTLNDFENADAKPGYFQQSLLVYGRTGEDCNVCKTQIQAIKLGGRNSFYCPQCQR